MFGLEEETIVYEVCALAATIILGVLGIELAIWLHSLRKFTDEAQQILHELNTCLPDVLKDVQALSKLGKRIGDTVSEAAAGLEKCCKNPLFLIVEFIGLIKQIKESWHEAQQKE